MESFHSGQCHCRYCSEFHKSCILSFMEIKLSRFFKSCAFSGFKVGARAKWIPKFYSFHLKMSLCKRDLNFVKFPKKHFNDSWSLLAEHSLQSLFITHQASCSSLLLENKSRKPAESFSLIKFQKQPPQCVSDQLLGAQKWHFQIQI